MSRGKKFAAAALGLAVLAGSVAAYAAFHGRLKGQANVSALSFDWDPDVVATNDGAGMNDPTGAGDTPTRETYDVGRSSASIVSNVLTLNVTAAYDGYRTTVSGLGHMVGGGSAGFRVQGVSLADVPAGSNVVAGLNPTQCGATLTAADTYLSIDLKLVDIAEGSSFTLAMDVEIVPAAAYSAATCNSWS